MAAEGPSAIVRAERLTANRRVDPVGLGGVPLLSWRIAAAGAATQEHRQIQFVEESIDGSVRRVWDSGRVADWRSTLIPYTGPTLASDAHYRWRVRVWLEDGRASSWSQWAAIELASVRFGTARWIGLRDRGRTSQLERLGRIGPLPILRCRFELPDEPVRARLAITALGLHDTTINARPVSSKRLAPRWTDYRKRIEYDSLDVTDLLHAGENVLASSLGEGWFAGRIAVFDSWHYGDEPALFCRLHVALSDGRRVVVRSDPSWRAATGPILSAGLLDGEVVDISREPVGWRAPGFDDTDWSFVDTIASPGVRLVPSRDEGIQVIEEWAPTVTTTPEAAVLVDTGQNLAGVLRVRVPRGARIQIRHGEALDAEGRLYTENLAGASQTDQATAAKDRDLDFEPRFTYHGFRYAEITGDTDRLAAGAVVVRALSSASRIVGSFECSNPLLNRLQQNIQWSLRSNFIGIPTDCPQRDERLGWTGDAAVFADTALFNADVTNFLDAWLDDLVDAQAPSGAFPDIAPVVGVTGTGNAGWADAGVSIPWSLFKHAGHETALARLYAPMRRFILFLEQDHIKGIRDAGRYGDWYALGDPTPREVVGTAFLAATADQFASIADYLGHDADAGRARRLARVAGEAFCSRLVRPDHTIEGDTQTGYVLALAFGLVAGSAQSHAVRRLVELIEGADTHLATGFLGTPRLLPILSENGRHELACRLIERTSYPSWLYPVAHGATTTWERWDGWTEEGGFADPALGNSLNHYALGAVGAWMYEYLGGLRPLEPGYRTTRVAPRPGGSITWATTRHESLYGEHSVTWTLEDGTFRLEIDVPGNTSANVFLPAADGRSIRVEGSDQTDPAPRVHLDPRNGSFLVGPGHHAFLVDHPVWPAGDDASRA